VKAAVLGYSDDHGDDGPFLPIGFVVELFAEFHDVHAMLTQGRTDRWRRVRLAGRNLQFHETFDFFRHDSILFYNRSTCKNPSSTGVPRPRMLTRTLRRRRSCSTSSTWPL